jgi:hypothetical protein
VSHALSRIIAPAQQVVIIAHSRGGASTADALRSLPRANIPNIRAISRTDSVHYPQQTDHTFRSLAVNWVSFNPRSCLFCQVLILLW